MKKKNSTIGVFFLLTLLATVFLSSLTPITIITTEKTTHNNLNYVSSPKTSATPESYENFTVFDSVNTVSLSGDGKYIAVTSAKNITLFNRTSQMKMWNFTTDDASMEAKISAVGEHIVVMLTTPPYDNVILLLNKTFSTQKTIMWNYTLIDKVNSIDISALGDKIVVGGNDENVTLLDNAFSNNKLPVWTYNVTDIVRSVAISADGKYVAACHDQNVTLFDVALGKPIWSYNATPNGLPSQPEYIDISYNGRYIAFGDGKNITYLDTTQKKCLWTYEAEDVILSLEMSEDGKYIGATAFTGFKAGAPSAGFLNNSVENPKNYMWEISQGEDMKISADGKYAIVGIESGPPDNVSLYDRTYDHSNKEALWTDEFPGAIRSIDISAIGDYFVAGFSDGKVYLFYHDVPIPPALLPLLGDDDDDDDDDEPAIPFGNYYLIFIALGILSLIVVYRRKLFSNKN